MFWRVHAQFHSFQSKMRSSTPSYNKSHWFFLYTACGALSTYRLVAFSQGRGGERGGGDWWGETDRPTSFLVGKREDRFDGLVFGFPVRE